ncbi:MAG: hypothetical protein HY908_20845 [Myxococcales bacterium]|nr:hypothetical protein [Myxococcales bacterium]
MARRGGYLGMALAGLLSVGAAGSVVVLPTTAHAQPKAVDTLVKRGQELFDNAQYEESIQTLSAALMRPGIGRRDKVEVFRLLAYNYIVLGRTEEADAAVRGLLVLDEAYELPESESPRFRDFFGQTRKKWESEGKPGKEEPGAAPAGPSVTIKHASPAQVDADSPISLDGTIEDPAGSVARVKLYYRTGSTGKFESAPVQYTMLRFTAEIPAAAVAPPLVEYYLEALDENGIPAALRGDAETPLRVAVPEGSSVISSPWLWVPVSLVVVGGIVATVVVLTTRTTTSTVTVGVFE